MKDHLRKLHNVALIGFMGCGKSSTGHHLAAILGFDFVDTDALIEHQAGTSISQIFQESGEAAFREMEARVALHLAERRRLVIATGGGFVTNPANLASIRQHSLVVCLWASPETIYERIRHQDHRPLLRDPHPLERIRSLLAQREAAYKQADILLNTEQRSTRELAQQIAHQFHSLEP